MDAWRERPVEVGDSDPSVVPAGLIDVLDDRRPDDSPSPGPPVARLASDAKDCANRRADWRLVTADDDNCRCAVAGM